MGKTTTKLLTFLLVLVMLFSVSATTIFAAEEAGAGSTASTGETGSTGADSTNATTNSGEYDLDWFKIEYSGNDVIITLNPAKITSLDSLKKITDRELVKFIVEIGANVVFDDIKDEIIGSNAPTDPVEFVEFIMDNVLKIYITQNYGALTEDTKHAFYSDILENDAKVEAFTDFICTIFRAAVITEIADNDQFPIPADYAGTVKKYFNEIISDFTGVSEDIIDAALVEKFGLTLAEFEARLDEIDAIFIEAYTEAYEKIEIDNNGLTDCVLLLDLLDKVEVNGLTLFGDTANGKSFILDTLIALAKELPSFTAISEMEDDEMQLSYAFHIYTDLGDSEFNVTLKLGDAHETVRKVAAIIARNLNISKENGQYVIQVTVPDELAKAALKACQSSSIPDSIKQKVFGGFSANVDEMYAFINNVTFDELMQIFEYVDFDQILDHEFLSQFEILDGLTEAQIKAKIEQYEEYYDVALDYLAKAYGYLPESVKEKTLLDFYQSNGKFEASGTKTINIYSLANKVSETIGDLVDAFIDNKEITLSAKVEVTFTDVYKVSYYKGTELVREGFLPVGANVDFFSGTTEYGGMTIIGWVDAQGNAYTEMPAKDVELYAVTADATAELSASVDSIVYGDGTIILTANVTPFIESATYTYTWYKNNVVIDGATAATLEIANVADSGEYHVVVEINVLGTAKTETTNKVSVKIDPKAITASDIVEWDYTDAFEYDATENGVNATVKAEYQTLVGITGITGNTAANAGKYTATVTLELLDPNYAFTAGNTVTLEWTIDPKAFTDSDITWVIPQDMIYEYGKTYTVTAKYPAELKLTLTNDAKTNAGTYVTTATVEVIGGANYVWAGSAELSSGNWTIAAKSINLSTLTWSAYSVADATHDPAKFNFTYNGTVFGVKINNAPEDLAAAIVYTNATATDAATKIIASADLDLVNNPLVATNYNISGTIPSQEWSIAKAVISTDNLEWTKVEFTYNAQTQKPELKNFEYQGIVLEYVYEKYENGAWVAAINTTDAGTYRVTVTVKASETPNYVLGSDLGMSTTYVIAKKAIPVDFTWNYTDPFTYTGSDITINLNTSSLTAEQLALLEITGTTSTGKNAGKYTASATVKLLSTANYVLTVGGNEVSGSTVTIDKEWEIAKAVITVGTLEWNYTAPITYTGSAITVTLNTTGLSDKLTVVYTDNEKTDAGIYNAQATISLLPEHEANYKLDDAAVLVYNKEWQISPKAIDLGTLTWADFTNPTYNGQELANPTVTIPAELAGIVTVTYTTTYNGVAAQAVNAGAYVTTVTITVGPNYTVTFTGSDSKEWSIERANLADYLATLGIAFNPASVQFNNKAQSLLITGTLPESITVTYEGNGQIKVGVYTVTAKFTSTDPNFTETAELQAALTITSGQCSNRFETEGVIVEVGGAGIDNGHTLSAVGNLDQLKDIDLSALAGEGKIASFIAAYEIEFMFGDAISDVEGAFTVKIRIPAAYASATGLKAVYVSETGEIEVLESTTADGYIVFETTHFSTYGIVNVADEVVDQPDDKNNSWIWIIIAILLVIIIVLVILLIVKKKNEGDEPEQQTEPEVVPPTDDEPAPAAEEPVVEEAPAEEPAPVEEAPVEEAPAPVEEPAPAPAPAEPAPGSFAAIVAASADADAVRLVNGVIVPVRYRTSFMSRLIQAEPPIQDYYTVVKNYILSYKGVKARTSWNFESFNKGRIQCAKLNVKGNAFQVYLGLDPNEYNVEKYHFVDVGDKPKLDKVPMMLKVKSDRSLKYVLELVDEVMSKNEITQGEIPNEDYHLPYESTEALVDRDLVKVILPDGMEIDENTIIERVNVGDMLASVKPEDEAEGTAPATEEVKVRIVDHHVAEEDIVNVDAVAADEIVTDAQAKELVQTIARTPGLKPKSNKLYEVNLDTICENFEDGDTVTIESLKSKNIITKKADKIKVLARGVMTKKLTVVADKFSIQAIKMIGLAGGLAQKYKD